MNSIGYLHSLIINGDWYLEELQAQNIQLKDQMEKQNIESESL